MAFILASNYLFEISTFGKNKFIWFNYMWVINTGSIKQTTKHKGKKIQVHTQNCFLIKIFAYNPDTISTEKTLKKICI